MRRPSFFSGELHKVTRKLPSIQAAAVASLLFLFPPVLAHSGEAPGDASQMQMVILEATAEVPVVEVLETIFDFGEVREGKDYVHAFKIVNTGTGFLEIEKVLTG